MNLAREPQLASFSGTRSLTAPYKEEDEYIKGMWYEFSLIMFLHPAWVLSKPKHEYL